MSLPLGFEEDGRSDSATNLSPSDHKHSTSWSVHTVPARISASSAVPYSAPWSHVNTRGDQDQTSSQWQPQLLTPAPTFDNFNSLGFHSQHLAEPLAKIESTLRISVPDNNSPTFGSSLPSPPLPLASTVASNDTTLSTLPTSHGAYATTLGHDIIYCPECGTSFTGPYKRGNLKRHATQRHSETKGTFMCMAQGCSRVFKRADARLKHARKSHPGLVPEPVWRKHHGNESATAQPTGSIGGSHQKRQSIQKKPPSSQPTMDFIPTSCSDDYETGSVFSKPADSNITQRTDGPLRSSAMDTQESSVSSLDFNVGLWMHSTPQTSVCESSTGSHYQQKLQHEDTSLELPRTARLVFASLHAKLDDRTYSGLCDTTFRRWDAVLQRLRDKQSNSYPVYAKVISDLYSVTQAIESGAIDSGNLDHILLGFRSCQPLQNQSGHSGALGGFNLSNGTSAGSSYGTNSKFDQHKVLQTNGSGPDVRVTKKEKPKKSESKPVNCPEYKRWLMMPHPSSSSPKPCSGCRETLMSQVRSHLNRVSHRDFTTAKQCPVCKKDFVDQQAYDIHKDAKSCQPVAQTRNDIILQWARLYLARYPNDTRIPIPFCDEHGWLPESKVQACRESMFLPSTSFLGRQASGPSISLASTPSIAPVPVDERSYNQALNFVLQNTVAPIQFRTNNTQANALANRVSGLNEVGPEAGLSGPTVNSARSFLEEIRGARTRYFALLAVARHYLPEEEILTVEAETTVQSMDEYERRQTHQTQNQNPTPSTPALTRRTYGQPILPQLDTGVGSMPSQYMDPNYLTPVYSHPSPAASHEQYGGVGMSAHPSSQGFNTGSSGYQMSYNTGPSSVQDSSDRMIRSPCAQSENSWAFHSPAIPTFSLGRSTARSPQDGTIDPSILESPNDDYDAEIERRRRQWS